ncbi:hypothetical protein GF327_09840 [Candidatus Woesearchaeota archaeon]|nr:hypothetical protein [Candidatus Woesearchaeota archaeon]
MKEKKIDKKIILKKIEENSKEIRKFGVKKLVLFGSYAHNNQDIRKELKPY